MRNRLNLGILALILVGAAPAVPCVRVSGDGSGFVLVPEGKRFVPWGFNYDHDEKSRLIEDYWEAEWPKIEQDFASGDG